MIIRSNIFILVFAAILSLCACSATKIPTNADPIVEFSSIVVPTESTAVISSPSTLETSGFEPEAVETAVYALLDRFAKAYPESYSLCEDDMVWRSFGESVMLNISKWKNLEYSYRFPAYGSEFYYLPILSYYTGESWKADYLGPDAVELSEKELRTISAYTIYNYKLECSFIGNGMFVFGRGRFFRDDLGETSLCDCDGTSVQTIDLRELALGENAAWIMACKAWADPEDVLFVSQGENSSANDSGELCFMYIPALYDNYWIEYRGHRITGAELIGVRDGR